MGAGDEWFDELLPGVGPQSYGDGFADVYDTWYAEDNTTTMVDLLASLAGAGPVLELGVGTGRLALPLAASIAPIAVAGLDASQAMLDALRDKDPDRLVRTVCGDMADGVPAGPFSLVYASYNTLLNLATLEAQSRCVRSVADALADDGRFVVEAFVPPTEPDRIEPERIEPERVEEVRVRSMTVDEVVLSVARYDPERKIAAGQLIEIRDGVAPRLRPWRVRYTSIDELDRMAADSGLDLEDRWADANKTAMSRTATRHLTVYKRRANDGD